MSHLTTTETTLLAVAALVPLVGLGMCWAVVDFRRLSGYLRTGAVVWLAVTFVVVNLIVDILYAWLNPKIRYE